MPDVQKVLFVCLGNICRSPIAEAVFQHLIKTEGIEDLWETDSAAIGGWHEGNPPDRRARDTLSRHKLDYHGKARQLEKIDFDTFDYIFGMDDDNITALNKMKGSSSRAKIMRLGDYDPEGAKIIRDPYFDNGAEGFETCFQQCLRCCKAFLDQQK